MFTSVHTSEMTLRRLGAGRRPGLIARLLLARRLRREMTALANLDDRLLNDVGLNRHEALRAADLPEWDAPAHWRA